MISLWYHVAYVPTRSSFRLTLQVDGQTYISFLSPSDYFSLIQRFPDGFEVGGLQIQFDNVSHSFVVGMREYLMLIWKYYEVHHR